MVCTGNRLLRLWVLLGALALSACIEDAEARRGFRRATQAAGDERPDSGVHPDASEPDSGPLDTGTDVFERHEWDISYSTHQISGSSWPSEQGLAAHTLTAVGDNATTGVSTAGLSAGGLGAARVNAAATVGDGSNGYISGSGWVVGDADCIWKRYLFRRTGASVSADYLDRFSATVTTSALGLRFTGTGGTTRHNELVVSSIATFSPAYTATLDTWELTDIVHLSTGGAGGVARRLLYRNGALAATTDHSVTSKLANLTGRYGIFGTQDGAGSPHYVQLVFIGWRFGCANMVTLEQHEADAADLGL